MRDIYDRPRSSTVDNPERHSIRRQWECAILLSGALAAASFAPHPIVLPIVSVILVAAAAFASGYAWMRSEQRTAGEFTRWDQALTGDSAEVLQFMESLSEARIASR
jgi:hypothetical protein